MRNRLLAGAAVAALVSTPSVADADAATGAQTGGLPAQSDVIVVIGLTGDPRDVPGSAALLTEADLDIQDYVDITRILRAVPGVNIQEEDGYGLRPNIGLRGTGVDRSSNITIMEDGVLIAPAPYAAPAAYYFPHAGRMAGIEIIKGAAGVRYGPRTQGGSINLLSTPVPQTAAGQVSLWFGDEQTRRGHAWWGGMHDLGGGVRLGGLIEAFTDSAEGFKILDNDPSAGTGYRIRDYNIRTRLEFSGAGAQHAVELRYQTSDEVSNETYLGLTDADFAASPYRRYAGSALDRIDAENRFWSLRYSADMANGLRFGAVAYRTEFARDWFKLEQVDPDGAGPMGAVGLGTILADPAAHALAYQVITGPAGFVSADNALRVRHNNREYYSRGVQLELAGEAAFAGADHQWRIGARWHYDEEDRFQWWERFRMDNGAMVHTSVDAPGSQDNRIGSARAFAAFVQDEISVGRWLFTPGVRYERIELKQENFGTADLNRTGANLVVAENTVDVVIPGLGVRYDVNERLALFGGVHRGFSPPSPGSASGAEDAVNWEFGARYGGGDWSMEAIGFYNAYDNLVGTCTASTGGGCVIGDQFDGGRVNVRGLELTAQTDIGARMGLSFGVPLRAAYTWTEAEFQTAFASGFGPWGNVQAGDRMPYIPEHQFYASIGIEAGRWGGQVALNWVGDVRTVSGQGAIPAAQLIESRAVADASAWVALTDHVRARVSVRNLTDEVYAAARSPAGLRPGAPRAVLFGITAAF
ncbi:MAG: TonB-dependent receptor [Maricaulaceae bacterium]|nr:TonB-dependent receptor [Maricaulaceae bacterium]